MAQEMEAGLGEGALLLSSLPKGLKTNLAGKGEEIK
jgi:hypothetical protein